MCWPSIWRSMRSDELASWHGPPPPRHFPGISRVSGRGLPGQGYSPSSEHCRGQHLEVLMGSASWIPNCLPGKHGPMGKNCPSSGQHDRDTLIDGASGWPTSAVTGGHAKPRRHRGASHQCEGLIAETRERLGRYSKQMDVLPVCDTRKQPVDIIDRWSRPLQAAHLYGLGYPARSSSTLISWSTSSSTSSPWVLSPTLCVVFITSDLSESV
jgi:hypothetical protein